MEEGSKIGSVVVATDGDGEGREGGSALAQGLIDDTSLVLITVK